MLKFLQRFEQTGGDKGTARKIGTAVRIPSSISMAPYTSAAQSASKSEPTNFTSVYKYLVHRSDADNPNRYPGPERMYEYDLFAVINHEGEINTGHYTNFARYEDEVRLCLFPLPYYSNSLQWYRYDDEKWVIIHILPCLFWQYRTRITPSSLHNVLNSPVPIYMAFYVKRAIEYKNINAQSYTTLARETKVEREREDQRIKAEQQEREREARDREIDNDLLEIV
jgi:ubiquitin carboxyl-terminal hydrolase 22/27/51